MAGILSATPDQHPYDAPVLRTSATDSTSQRIANFLKLVMLVAALVLILLQFTVTLTPRTKSYHLHIERIKLRIQLRNAGVAQVAIDKQLAPYDERIATAKRREFRQSLLYVAGGGISVIALGLWWTRRRPKSQPTDQATAGVAETRKQDPPAH